MTETVPAGMTLISMSGSGWTCSGSGCTRSDSLAANASYPVIAVTVNVSATAAGNLTNTAAVSGGGETNTANDQATDPTAIQSSAPSISIWSNSAVPGTPFTNSPPLTLGVRFRSDAGGSITGIRYYKGVGNIGTHIGVLYSNSGVLLAQATFQGETASGWQTVAFTTPVAISANTTYIAAYFSPSGYGYDLGYFSNSGMDNGPLHALRSGVDGPNGLYAFGGAPTFPASSVSNTNFSGGRGLFHVPVAARCLCTGGAAHRARDPRFALLCKTGKGCSASGSLPTGSRTRPAYVGEPPKRLLVHWIIYPCLHWVFSKSGQKARAYTLS